MKKLIYVLNSYSKNSVQHFYHVENLLIQMANNGIQIALVIEKADGEPVINHPNILVICQKKTRPLQRSIELVGILKKLIKDNYRKIFVRISINAAILSIISGFLFGGKVYYWQSGTTLEVDSQKSGVKKIRWLVLDYSRLWFVKTFVHRFVTGPEYMVDYYSQSLRIPKSRMLMLYNDIDIARFRVHTEEEKRMLRYKLGFDEDLYIILMVHRLSPVRKTDLYIPTIMEDPFFAEKKIKLLIVGDGPERKQLEMRLEYSPAKNRIEFLGSKANREIQDYYAVADLFVNPSYTEGFPRVVIEAMASGLPIVATNAGGTGDLFGDVQKKYVVERTDPALLSKKIIELYSSPATAKLCSDENKIISRRYSTQEVACQYEKGIFEEAL